MIYLDNAATTWPKPPAVAAAMIDMINNRGANPGRGGHTMSLEAGRLVYRTRELLAKFFGITDSARLVFTLNCTDALNLALQGILKPGDHVVTSSMEHNSVIRPLEALKEKGVSYTAVRCRPNGELDPSRLEQEIRPETRLIVLTHASNVTGTLMPIAEVGEIAAQHGVLFLVDAAQTAGIFPIDVEELKIDLLAFPGHKGLYGPTGTGGLYIREGLSVRPLRYGGTGSHSESFRQPEQMPEGLESGTVNSVGIAGLGAGVESVIKEGPERIREHETVLLERLRHGLASIPGIIIYGQGRQPQAPTLSVNLAERDSQEIAFLLDNLYQIEVRAGLHCAAVAHRTLGTIERGVVRFSLSYFNTEEQIDQTVNAMREIAGDLSHSGL